MRAVFVSVTFTLLSALFLPAATAQASASCTFQLGFAVLQELLPDTVGTCVDDESYNPTTGDAVQQTSGGLLVWRKADNWTAFTDGYHTWINGPDGLVKRLNTERFPWEGDFTGDPRFGVVLLTNTQADDLHALDALHTRWYIGGSTALQYGPTHVQNAAAVDLATLAQLAARYPGRVWDLGLEPNGWDQRDPRAQPAAYATLLHGIAVTLHAADPTAQLVGPDVLNWSANCVGCGGMTTGQAWTEAMRAAYLAQYGEDLPFDIWSIHTYPLDWQHLPTVNYQLMEEQLTQFRQWIDSIPAQQGKPIWDTELGVHWGYTAYTFVQQNGQSVLVPAGTLRSDLVTNYFQQMLTWLEENGAQENITRWFVYGSYNPDVPGDHAGAISLLDGSGPDAQLTSNGQIYAAAAAAAP